MELSRDVKVGIADYLRRVAANLRDVTPEELLEVQQNLEEHLYDALEARAPQGATLDDLRVVLADMAPPESYGDGKLTVPADRQQLVAGNGKSDFWAPLLKRLDAVSWEMVVGVILIPITLWWNIKGVTALFFPRIFTTMLPKSDEAVYDLLLPIAIGYFALGITGAILATLLGKAATEKIVGSGRVNTAFRLAVFVRFFYPGIAINLPAVWLFSRINGPIASVGYLIWALIILVPNLLFYLHVRMTTRKWLRGAEE